MIAPIGWVAATVSSVLADGGDTPSDVNPNTGHGPEWGEAAPIGLLVIVLLCVAGYFLARSMSRNIKKVPRSFDAEELARLQAEDAAKAAADGLSPDGRPLTPPGAAGADAVAARSHHEPMAGRPGGAAIASKIRKSR